MCIRDSAALIPAKCDGSRVSITIANTTHAFAAHGAARGDVIAVLRPDAMALAPSGAPRSWSGTVISRRFAGGHVAYQVKFDERTTVEIVSTDRRAAEGSMVSITIAREPVAVVAP